MTGNPPPARTPAATGIASGSLGTGTAVDEETTLMAVPDVPEATAQPKALARAPTADSAPAAQSPPATETAPPAAPAAAVRRPTARRDPYRPLGIALAAILVALAGVAALSSGGDTPAQIEGPPLATASPGNAAAGDEDAVEGGGGGNEGNNGNGNGRGNGNGGDNGRGNDD